MTCYLRPNTDFVEALIFYNMRKIWEKQEIDFLKTNYATMGIEYCSCVLERSAISVSKKAYKLNLKVNKDVCNELKKKGKEKSNKTNLKDRTGEKFRTYQGYEVEIIEYFGARNCTVIFNDFRNTIRKNVAIKELKEGSIKNYYHPEVSGVGYIGEGKYTARIDRKMTKCYRTWFNMLSRCYKNSNNRRISYKDVTVCEEWHNFQNFAKWFYSNFNSDTMQGWHIDKDIICPNCKIYSPDTCCFLPNEVNVIFKRNNESCHNLPRGVHPKDNKFQASINKFGSQCYLGLYDTIEEAHQVYIKAKKEYLIEVSEKWKGTLSDKVCDAIKNFDILLL